MKNMMKKILSAALCAALMLVLLTGCSSDADKLVGSWSAEIDMTELVNEELSGVETSEEDVFSDFKLTLNMTFNEDGTYKMEVDPEKLDETIEIVKADMEALMIEYYEELIAAEGINMTVDEMLTLAGTDMDTLLGEVGIEEAFQEIAEQIVAEGNYDAKNGKLFLSDSKDSAIDEEVYELYTLEGDVLTFTGGYPETESVIEYPIVFNKVG